MWVWAWGCAATTGTTFAPSPPVETQTTTLTVVDPPPPPASCATTVVAAVESQPHVRVSDRQVDLTLVDAQPAALLCRAQDDPDDRFLLESAAPAVSHSFRLQGIRPDTLYDCAVGATCPGATARPLTIDGGPAPAFFPRTVVTTHPDHPDPDGWLLAGVLTEGCVGPGALAVFDLQGRLRWHAPLEYTGLDFELTHLGGGVLLYGGHSMVAGPVQTHLWDGELLALDVPGDAYLHHDCKQIADGRILTLEERQNSAGASTWTGFAVRGYDPASGSWEDVYDSQTGVDEDVLSPGFGDTWHANWIDVKDHGDGSKLYVSLCNVDDIVRIDLASQTIDWVLGEGQDFTYLDSSGAALGDLGPTQCQHGLEVSDDGTQILVYDNGVDRGESRALVYTIDEAARTATVDWTWTDGWFEPILGDVDWLDAGTVLVTQGHAECYVAEGHTAMVEFDPVTGEEWWRLTFPNPWNAAYRSERLDGCALFSNVGECPALEAGWAALAPAFGL